MAVMQVNIPQYRSPLDRLLPMLSGASSGLSAAGSLGLLGAGAGGAGAGGAAGGAGAAAGGAGAAGSTAIPTSAEAAGGASSTGMLSTLAPIALPVAAMAAGWAYANDFDKKEEARRREAQREMMNDPMYKIAMQGTSTTIPNDTALGWTTLPENYAGPYGVDSGLNSSGGSMPQTGQVSGMDGLGLTDYSSNPRMDAIDRRVNYRDNAAQTIADAQSALSLLPVSPDMKRNIANKLSQAQKGLV